VEARLCDSWLRFIFGHGRKKIRPDVTMILVEEGLRAMGAVYDCTT
jgi:hypothetical protein